MEKGKKVVMKEGRKVARHERKLEERRSWCRKEWVVKKEGR